MTTSRAPRVTFVAARPALPAGRETVLDLLIRIEAPEPERPQERRALNFGIVLDRSGSMRGPKLARAREAVAFAVRNMSHEDRVSLTIYNTEVETLVASAPLSTAGPAILGALAGVHSGGSTALHDGWVRGGLEVSGHLERGRVNRVLLVSDGLANVGETRVDVLVSRCGELFARGVSTSTVGVGSDFNEDLMIPMAVSGGGAGWFVETPDDFTRIFEAELAGLASLFGERGVTRLEPRRAGTTIAEVLNDFPRAEDGTGWKIGTLSHGQPMEILARVKTRGGEIGQPLDLLDVRLSWDTIGQGRFELQQLFRIGCDEPVKVEAMPIDPDVDRVVHLLMAARARVEAIGYADAGDVGSAARVLAAARAKLSALFEQTGDAEAGGEEQALQELLRLYEQGGRDELTLARKRASYEAYYRSSGSRRKP